MLNLGEKVYCNVCHLAIAPLENRRIVETSVGGFRVTFTYHNRYVGDCWHRERTALLIKRAAITGGNRLGVIQ